MPGIVGLVSRSPRADCVHTLHAMLQTMLHDPSYVHGSCAATEAGVYAAWVAHGGSFAARESGSDATGRRHLALSGECFAGLTDRHVRSHTDEDHGARFDRFADELSVRELNGLFAGLLIDKTQQRALLFNDRYGAERIYWASRGEHTYFASEAKALLRVLPETRYFDDEGVAQLLRYGCTIGPRSLFRGIRVLPGASFWEICLMTGRISKRTYFQPEHWELQGTLPACEFESRFEKVSEDVIPRYFQATGAIGVSVTGGLDTRLLMACRPRAAPPAITYTFVGSSGTTLDARIGAQVAEACGLKHRVLRLDSDFLGNYRAHLDRTVYLTDGCAGATKAHEIDLTHQAAELAPIRLTGNFGSEVLRSVSTFKGSPKTIRLLSPDLERLSGQPAEEAAAIHPVTYAAFREIPWFLFGAMAAGRSQVGFRTPYLDNDIVELAYLQPAELRGSADPTVRLIRGRDPRLASIPTDRGLAGSRGALTSACRRLYASATFKLDYLYYEGLRGALSPMEALAAPLSRAGVLGQHKYLPYRIWFRDDLAEVVADELGSAQQLPYWSKGTLVAIATRHAAGKQNFLQEIDRVLTLSSIRRTLVARPWPHIPHSTATALTL